MSAIPQEWIEAGADAIHSDLCPDDPDDGEHCGCAPWTLEAELVLTAVLPLIREAIAREIEAQCEADEPPCLGCFEAARTARGGAL